MAAASTYQKALEVNGPRVEHQQMSLAAARRAGSVRRKFSFSGRNFNIGSEAPTSGVLREVIMPNVATPWSSLPMLVFSWPVDSELTWECKLNKMNQGMLERQFMDTSATGWNDQYIVLTPEKVKFTD